VWEFSAEEIQAWVAASNVVTAPVLIKGITYRCDSCKRFMSALEMRVEYSTFYSHLTKECLTKFANKHMKNLDLSKAPQQIQVTGDV